ncbi:hypothetical protein ACLOJK_001468 [Asimina triloba]
MPLAKERAIAQNSHSSSICYGNASSIQVSDPSLGYSGFEDYEKAVVEEGDGLERMGDQVKNFAAANHLPSLSNLHEAEGSSELMFSDVNSPPDEVQSLLNFKSGPDQWAYSGGSVLSFDQRDHLLHSGHQRTGHEDNYAFWINLADRNNQSSHLNLKGSIDSRLVDDDDMNCFMTASGYGSTYNGCCSDNQQGDMQHGWPYTGAVAEDGIHEPKGSDGCYHKRPYWGADMQALKKHCSSPPKKAKPKPAPSKDPQSIAAKNRRERISERLKTLQDLVPNGAKVDLVTMLEKAISYVKFLQLQVKVLATDEFWPAQGGKAPEVSQVKEAVDAILSSHRDRNSSST